MERCRNDLCWTAQVLMGRTRTKRECAIECEDALWVAIKEGCNVHDIVEHEDYFSFRYKRNDWSGFRTRVFCYEGVYEKLNRNLEELRGKM